MKNPDFPFISKTIQDADTNEYRYSFFVSESDGKTAHCTDNQNHNDRHRRQKYTKTQVEHKYYNCIWRTKFLTLLSFQNESGRLGL